jgi:hypothetical protein
MLSAPMLADPGAQGAGQVIRHREVGRKRWRPRQRGPDSMVNYNLDKIFVQIRAGAQPLGVARQSMFEVF